METVICCLQEKYTLCCNNWMEMGEIWAFCNAHLVLWCYFEKEQHCAYLMLTEQHCLQIIPTY